MHNCEDFQNRLMDAAFDETDAVLDAGFRAEADDCPECADLYRSLRTSGAALEEAFAADRPDEAYWNAYAARLDARIASATPLWRRVIFKAGQTFGVLLPAPFQIPVAVGALVLAIGFGLWFAARIAPRLDRDIVKSPASSIADKVDFGPAFDPTAPSRASETGTPSDVPQKSEASANRTVLQLPRVLKGNDTRATRASSDVDAPLPISAAAVALTRHVENAQLLLRAFRNADLATDQDTLDLAYEKRLSRSLLTQNILLRRDAEERGNLPVEDALSALETILIDIANLPESATSDDLRQIQDRIRRGEIIATLQALNQSAVNEPPPFPSLPSADEEQR